MYIVKTVQQNYTREDGDRAPESRDTCGQFQSLIMIAPIRASVSQKESKFRTFLLEAVDESLSTLGEESKKAVYYHLQESFDIGRREIPEKTYEFASAIEKMFGEGAKLLEIQIMKSLHRKTRGTLKRYHRKEELSFTEYLQALQEI